MLYCHPLNRILQRNSLVAPCYTVILSIASYRETFQLDHVILSSSQQNSIEKHSSCTILYLHPPNNRILQQKHSGCTMLYLHPPNRILQRNILVAPYYTCILPIIESYRETFQVHHVILSSSQQNPIEKQSSCTVLYCHPLNSILQRNILVGPCYTVILPIEFYRETFQLHHIILASSQ